MQDSGFINESVIYTLSQVFKVRRDADAGLNPYRGSLEAEALASSRTPPEPAKEQASTSNPSRT